MSFNNASILLFRMPAVINSSIVVEIEQSSPFTRAVVRIPGVALSQSPSITTSVSRISMQGGTIVVVTVKNYIPITKQSDIDITCITSERNISVNPTLVRATTIEATFQFQSPMLNSTVDLNCAMISRINSVLGVTAPNASFALTVFDSRYLFLIDSSQKRFYSSGGPRVLSINVRFLKGLVSVIANLVRCVVLSSPSLDEIRLDPDSIQNIRVVIPDFPSNVVGDISVEIFSGSEMLQFPVSLIATPTSPVLFSVAGNRAIPSGTNSAIITASFQEFIASANTSSFMVLVPALANFSLSATNVFSDFQRTTVSFRAPQLGSMGSQSSIIYDAFVVDLSSACGKNLTCLGRFQLQYSNVLFPSFVTMTPLSGLPSVSTLVNVVLTNVRTTNISLVTVSVGAPHQANVLAQVTGATFGGSGLNSQTVVTFHISWIGNPRPSSMVDLALSMVLDSQVLLIPAVFTFMPNTRPQLLSLGPSSVPVFGGRHVAAFIQPAAFGYLAMFVAVDGVNISLNASSSGDLLSFNSPKVSNVRTSSVLFTLVGTSGIVTLSSLLFYTEPPAVTVKSVFPSLLSSFGSISQVQLTEIPMFWSANSVRSNLVQGASSTPCTVLELFRSSTEAVASISCPAANPGYGNLEIFDASAVEYVARSKILDVVIPTALQFVSISPSQYFLSKSSQMTLIVKNFPVGLSPRISFIRPAPLLDISANVLSSYFEPSNVSTTQATIVVSSPSSVNSFAVSLSVTSTNGLAVSCISSFFSAVDDSLTSVLSVKPSFISSIGGSVEVLVSGFPPSLISSNISATFAIVSSLKIAAISSCSYDTEGRVIVIVQISSLDLSASTLLNVSLTPQNFESKSVTFSVYVEKVQPSLESVVPSLFSNAGGEVLTVRLPFFPIITSASFIQAHIGGVSSTFSVSIVSSRPEVSIIRLQMTSVNITASGTYQLLVNYIIAPPISLTVPVVIQLTSRAFVIVPPIPIQINRNTTAIIPIIVAFPDFDFQKFRDFPVGSSFSSVSTTASGESLCFSVFIANNPDSSRCSDIGCIVQQSGRTNYRILSKNVPYSGCISFGVQYSANAALLSASPRIQEMSVFWSAFCNNAQIGIERFSVVGTTITPSPSTGAVSGGYIVSLSIVGIPTNSSGISVSFGNTNALITSQAVLASGMVIRVICPSSVLASTVDVSIQVGASILASSKFTYVLGCLDYNEFCSNLQGGFVANVRMIANDPPSFSACSTSYCIAASSISPPVLVSFPGKQSTSIVTIAFSVRNLFAASASQIRVAVNDRNIFLPVIASSYTSTSDVFSLTAQMFALFESSVNTICVYSANTGPSLNATFELTSLAPIVGPIRVLSVSPSAVPFEGTSSLRLFLSNFPFNMNIPAVIFSIQASYQNQSIIRNVSVLQSSSFHEFGNGSIVLTLQPSSIISQRNGELLGLMVNMSVNAVGFSLPNSAFFQVMVRQRVIRQIVSISAVENSVSSSTFRSITGTSIAISLQGFDGPDVTICFGFKSSVPNRNFLSCGLNAIAQDQNCFISRNSVFYGDPVSTISMPYPRDFFSTLSSTATVADLTVRVSDFTNLDACNFGLNSRIVDCGPDSIKCLNIIPANSASLRSEPPSSVPFITVLNDGTISGSQIFLTFSNFFASTDSVSARIGSETGPNAFPRIQDGCTFLSCMISVLVGGKPDDATLLDSDTGVKILVVARNTTVPVQIPRVVAPAAIVVPSLVSASGGGTITVTSFSFSRFDNTVVYTLSNPAFSIIKSSKVGNLTTIFEIRLMIPLSAGSQSVSILSATPKVRTESFIVELFPAVALINPAISTCIAGGRRVHISVSNLPISLYDIDVSITFNNIPRPAVVMSSASLNFSFPCDENVASQALLSMRAAFAGSLRQASTLVTVPPLPLIMSLVVGETRFPLNSSRPTGQAATLCSSNALAISNSRCRTAIVNTQLHLETSAFDVRPIRSSSSVMSLSIFVISSSPGNSLFSFIFDPSEITPSGLYNLVLTANSRTSSMLVSVFNPVVSAICVSPACSINANVGGVVSIILVNFASGSIDAGDIALSASKLDGTALPSLRFQLTAFSSSDSTISVQIDRYGVGSDFQNGQLVVQLNVALASSPSTNVNVLVVLRLDPQVLSVDFTESLTSLIISMNQPVIAMFSPANCSSLFANTTEIRFGMNPVCSISSNSIFVQFGSDSAIISGDMLSILPGNIIPADGFPTSNAALFPAVAAVPSTFRKTSVEIKGTQYVEQCSKANPAFITAIAFSPRPFAAVTWRCPACSNDASALTSFLSAAQGLSISISAFIISTSKCRINAPCGIAVTVVDFLGRSSVSAPFFIYAAQDSVPDLQIAPLEHLRYSSDMSIVLRTRFRFSTCFGDTLSVPIFSWRISPSPSTNLSLSTGPRLLLPPNSLLPGTYRASVTALLDGATVSAEQSWTVAQRALLASLSAPSFVSIRSNVSLDATNSRDLEISIRPSRTLLFSWTCTYENQPCLDSAGNQLLLPQRSLHQTITMPARTLTPGTISESSSFYFTVEVSNSDDSRVASSVAEVKIVQDAIPSVLVSASSNIVNSGSAATVEFSAVVIPADPTVGFIWSEISGLIPGGINAVLYPAFSIRSPSIVINSSILVPGRPYVFQAAVANNIKASATASVSVNAAPSSGKCYILSVQTGATVTAACRTSDRCNILSRITVSCENWMDENLPLKYQIGYRTNTSTGVLETRLDYKSDAILSIQLPIGIQNLFVDICDSSFACSTFASFSENPMHIFAVTLSTQQLALIDNEITKSVQSGDVDAFADALAVSISNFRSTLPAAPIRRLLNVAYLQSTSNQISAMALKVVDSGGAITLAQQLSNLLQVTGAADATSFRTLLPALVGLSSLFRSAESNSQIQTAAKASANSLSRLSNIGAMTTGTIFQDMKRLEANLANAMLQKAQTNQLIDVKSDDNQFALRAASVVAAVASRNNAPVIIKAPSLTLGSDVDFTFPLNVNDGSTVSVVSSFTPKSQYAASVPTGGNVLMSDVADCTVTKRSGLNSAVIKSGAELGSVTIRVPFTLSASGAGSAAALSQDPQSVKIAYYDETVSPPVWKYDGCTGTTTVAGLAAVFTATCSHLTSFGIIAAPPAGAPLQTQPANPNPGNPVIPIPIPGATVSASTSPSSPSSSNEFPLWAIIFIPVAGGVALLSVGGFFVYRRISTVRTRAKQIVAASAWKTLSNVSTVPKPPVSTVPKPPASSVKAPDGQGPTAVPDSPAPAEVPDAGKLSGAAKRPDFAALVSMSKTAEVSLPLPSAVPSVASNLSSAASVMSRRQELANRAAGLAETDIEMSGLSSAVLRPDVARRLPVSTSPERQDSGSPGQRNLQNSMLSVIQRRQQHKGIISEAWSRASSSQISPPQMSPPRLPSRLPSVSPLSRSQISPRVASPLAESTTGRSRSSSRSHGAAGSPFFVQQSPQSSVNRARSPLPASKTRASSVARATSPMQSGQPWTASSSVSPDRFGSSSLGASVSRLSPTSAGPWSPHSASAPRSTSTSGFAMPLRSSQDSLNSGYRARYDQA